MSPHDGWDSRPWDRRLKARPRPGQRKRSVRRKARWRRQTNHWPAGNRLKPESKRGKLASSCNPRQIMPVLLRPRSRNYRPTAGAFREPPRVMSQMLLLGCGKHNGIWRLQEHKRAGHKRLVNPQANPLKNCEKQLRPWQRLFR